MNRHEVVSARIPAHNAESLNIMAAQENLTRSDMIRVMLAYAVLTMPVGWRPTEWQPSTHGTAHRSPTVTNPSNGKPAHIEVFPDGLIVDGTRIQYLTTEVDVDGHGALIARVWLDADQVTIHRTRKLADQPVTRST